MASVMRYALPVLTAAEEQELIARLPESRDLLVRHNLPLISTLAIRHSASAGRPDDPELTADLFQEGVGGFLRALERFEPERGHKLSTYAIWWIEQGIRRYLDTQSRTVRLPAYVVDMVRQVRRGKVKLSDIDGTSERVQMVKQLAALEQPREVSLDAVFTSVRNDTEVDARSRYDLLPSHIPDLDEQMYQEQLLQSLRSQLSPRHWEVLWRRAEGEILQQIADEWGVTRERVRQVEMEAREKARVILECLTSERRGTD